MLVFFLSLPLSCYFRSDLPDPLFRLIQNFRDLGKTHTSGQILLHRSQYALIEQLRFYPEADHDDGPDALEMLWRIARQYGGDWGYTPVVPSERYRGKQDDWED